MAKSVKAIKKRCLREWSKAIHRRDKGCQMCGRAGRTEAHHIIRRGTALHWGWFDMRNGVGICHHCHKGDPRELGAFEDRWLAEHDLDYDTLRQECFAGLPLKWKYEDYEEKIKYLKSLYFNNDFPIGG